MTKLIDLDQRDRAVTVELASSVTTATNCGRPSVLRLFDVILASLLLPLWCGPATASDVPKTALTRLGALGVVKEACSAVFVSNRNLGEFLEQSSKFWMAPEDKKAIASVQIDRREKTLTLKMRTGETERAALFGDQGCIDIPGPDRPSAFKPIKVRSALPSARSVAWPMGDDTSGNAWPAEVDQAGVSRAMDLAFASGAHTAAFLVLYKGQLIAERYGPGISRSTRLPGWSMTKSLQASWVGILAAEGRLYLYAPIPIAEWQRNDDPRKTIRWADLLRMSSGLSCDLGRDWFDYAGWKSNGYPDSLYVFMGQDDAYAYAVSRPAGVPPRTQWEYTNCQPLVVGKALTDLLAAKGDSPFQWPQAALYDKIGIRSMVVEPDRTGHLLTSAYGYATARDWARLGLLYQQDGKWAGQRLLSPDFMSFVRSPAPAAKRPDYGGQVWLNLASSYPLLPEDTYWFAGIEGQRVFIVPSYDLVIVRLGHGAGEDPAQTLPSAAAHSIETATATLLSSIHRPDLNRAHEVETVVDRFFKALFQDDEPGFRATVTDDFLIYESNGHPYTADELHALIKSHPVKRNWIISQFRSTVGKEVASVTYHNLAVFSHNGKREVHEWVETAVLRREDGRWMITLLNSNALEAE